MKKDAKKRHECINGLLKEYHILSDCFRHHRTKHGRVFNAVANIVQARIRLEKATYQVFYNDNYNY